MFEHLGLDPPFAWGLVSRGIGVVFLVSYTSFLFEVLPLAGEQGIAPATVLFDRIRHDFGWRRWLWFPSVLWLLGASDRVLRGLFALGWIAALAVVIGGPWSPYALLVCYLIYLSLDRLACLNFPWESMLFELTLLGLFIPATHTLPSIAAVGPPAPAIAWGFQILLFRVMAGFGKQKFLGSSKKDLIYLRGFLVWQPLPSPLGWYMQHLPVWMLRGAVLFMFLVEVPAPFLLFFPGIASMTGAALIALLMLAISVCGTYGYFSLVGIVACLPMLDPATPRALTWMSLAEHPLATAFMTIHLLGGLIHFPGNTWVTQVFLYNPALLRFSAWLTGPLHFYRAIQQLRLVHSYGVFRAECGPTARIVPLVEVTWDDQTWHECHYRLAPTASHDRPRFLAPHHARIDTAVTYEGLGLGGPSIIHSTAGLGNPYDFTHDGGGRQMAQRILEGSRTVAYCFKPGTFPADLGPPRAVRMTNHMLEPVSVEEHRKTGAWWRRIYIGPHLAPVRNDPNFWKTHLPEPELWHWDDVIWRRRTRLAPLLAGGRRGQPYEALVGFDGVFTADDVDRFWDELLPRVRPLTDDWNRFGAILAELHAAYDAAQMRRFERTFGRLHLVLLSRFEPLYLGRGMNPVIPAISYFQLAMLAHHVLLQGREAYARVYADPSSAAVELPKVNHYTGISLLALFRHEPFIAEAQKQRMGRAFGWMPELKDTTEAEQRVRKLAESWSAFILVVPFLIDKFTGPEFDHGFPERSPIFERIESGELVPVVPTRHWPYP